MIIYYSFYHDSIHHSYDPILQHRTNVEFEMQNILYDISLNQIPDLFPSHMGPTHPLQCNNKILNTTSITYIDNCSIYD